MNNIVLEKDVPLPQRSSGGKWKELVAMAEIGDSFLVPSDKRHNVRTAIGVYAKVAMRQVENNMTRLWILEKK